MEKEIREIELDLLLEAIFRRYGYDFRKYARSSLHRRIAHRLAIMKLSHIAELVHPVLEDESCFKTVLRDLSIDVTEMFRDPDFFQVLRKEILPFLSTYPFIRIWIAGCATGEEAYSMAILLKEEGLYERAKIYATDMNSALIQKAREGHYAAKRIRKYTENYHQSGGTGSFSDYYHAEKTGIAMDSALKTNIVFAMHHLATDEVFNEMHLILCRNVMIYFDDDLQNRALGLFHRSLCDRGFLGLGTRETLRFSDYENNYECVAEEERVYRKLS
ncbi:MAG: protein-glutamate O-methyltransferase CheR [SAR324 cluster bacterium]|nr:protein-glutamate O-methyltransferase CheR [SAR324 cluster bacterium]